MKSRLDMFLLHNMMEITKKNYAHYQFHVFFCTATLSCLKPTKNAPLNTLLLTLQEESFLFRVCIWNRHEMYEKANGVSIFKVFGN